MLGFAGVVTQSAKFDQLPFPYYLADLIHTPMPTI